MRGWITVHRGNMVLWWNNWLSVRSLHSGPHRFLRFQNGKWRSSSMNCNLSYDFYSRKYSSSRSFLFLTVVQFQQKDLCRYYIHYRIDNYKQNILHTILGNNSPFSFWDNPTLPPPSKIARGRLGHKATARQSTCTVKLNRRRGLFYRDESDEYLRRNDGNAKDLNPVYCRGTDGRICVVSESSFIQVKAVCEQSEISLVYVVCRLSFKSYVW